MKRQIRSKQFTQDIIDTLGNRLREVRIPLPKEPDRRVRVSKETRTIVESRAVLRQQARLLVLGIEGADSLGVDDAVL